MITQDKILAIVGMPGAGKSTLTAYLRDKYGYDVVYFGGLVIEEVKNRGLDVIQDNENIVRNDLRDQHGMAAMAVLSIPKIEAAIQQGKKVLIDGLYSMEEYELLKDKYGDQLITIAIHASRPIREERAAGRTERGMSPAVLKERDLREIKNLNKAPPIVLADYHFTNDGTEIEMTHWMDKLFS